MARRIHTKETVAVESDPTVSVVEPVHVVEDDVIVNNHVAAEEVGFKFYQIIYFFLGVLEVLLGLRFILKLFAANQGNPFVASVYNFTYPFVLPFINIFSVPTVGRSVVEWGTIIAMIVYALLAYALVQLVIILTTRRPTNALH